MRNKKSVFILAVLIIITTQSIPLSFSTEKSIDSDSTFVQKHGQLSVSGNYIVDKNRDQIVLRGMSLFWSQWMGSFYNESCVDWLKDDWSCTVIRAAMGVESGGYLQYPLVEMTKVKTIINSCINAGIYVIVDWHDHNAQNHLEQSLVFFKQIAQQYGNYPNIIYEIFNEPTQVSWTNDVKPYAIAVIDTIRKYDPYNIIVVGSPTWSQDVDTASRNPIERSNIAYSLHFYAATHKQALRNKAVTALNNGIALFVSEWGTCEASGTGTLDYNEVNTWLNFMEFHKISWCNWSLCDKDETSAALKVGASVTGGWPESVLSPSGVLVRSKILFYNDSLTTDVGDNYIPEKFLLYQNFPNPFNPATTIEYDLPINGNVKIEVYDLLGSKIKTLVNSFEYKGKHSVQWAGTSDSGIRVSSGVYLYSMNFEKQTFYKKAVFIN